MSGRIVLIVGVCTKTNSALVYNAPYQATILPIGENDEQSIVGMVALKELTCNAINVGNLDKVKLLELFETFKTNLEKDESAFETQEDKQAWFDILNKATVDILVLNTN